MNVLQIFEVESVQDLKLISSLSYLSYTSTLYPLHLYSLVVPNQVTINPQISEVPWVQKGPGHGRYTGGLTCASRGPNGLREFYLIIKIFLDKLEITKNS